MPGDSHIQWTDATWNPTVGCTRVSSGCDHCYAFELHDRRHAAWKAGRWPGAPKQYHRPFAEVQLIPDRLRVPLSWREPRRIFVDSMADLFHADVPDGFIAWVWLTMAATPQHTYQILTKRPRRMRDFVRRWGDLSGETGEPRLVRGPEATRAAHPSGRGQLFAAYLEELAASEPGGVAPEGAVWPTFDWVEGPRWWPTAPLPTVWLGVSVESQEVAHRIDWLRQTPAAVRFLSCEPLIGPLDLNPYIWEHEFDGMDLDSSTGPDGPALTCPFDWVIVGGESGPEARPMQQAWARRIVGDCREAGVAVFVKQLGAVLAKEVGVPAKGGDMTAWPAELDGLKVRQFPVAGS